MKKRKFGAIVFLFMISCRTNQAGSFTEGYVYDKKTNKAVAGASVCIWEGYEKGFLEVTKTDSEGYFSFNEKKKIVLGNNGKDLAVQFIIKKENMISDTLISYPNRDTIRIDTIYLQNRFLKLK